MSTKRHSHTHSRETSLAKFKFALKEFQSKEQAQKGSSEVQETKCHRGFVRQSGSRQVSNRESRHTQSG